MSLKDKVSNKHIRPTFKYYYQFSRDPVYVSIYNNKWFLFSYTKDSEEDEEDCRKIVVYSNNGKIIWTDIFNLEINENCLVSDFNNLYILANNWLNKYCGTY
jgi:hypothetical protein